MNVAIPPRSLNHRLPAACDAPTANAASSLLRPAAIRRQNARSTSRRSDGAPGDFNGPRPVNSFIHPAGLPIATPLDQVLRRPVESAQYTALAFTERCADAAVIQSNSRPGTPHDNAVKESFFATLQKEKLNRTQFATHEQARSAIFAYIECFYNRSRLHSTLGYRTPTEAEDDHYRQAACAS